MCSDAINFQTESKNFLLDQIKSRSLHRVARRQETELNSLPVANQAKRSKHILPFYILPLKGTVTLLKRQNNESRSKILAVNKRHGRDNGDYVFICHAGNQPRCQGPLSSFLDGGR